jgi:hypothetical protein
MKPSITVDPIGHTSEAFIRILARRRGRGRPRPLRTRRWCVPRRSRAPLSSPPPPAAGSALDGRISSNAKISSSKNHLIQYFVSSDTPSSSAPFPPLIPAGSRGAADAVRGRRRRGERRERERERHDHPARPSPRLRRLRALHANVAVGVRGRESVDAEVAIRRAGGGGEAHVPVRRVRDRVQVPLAREAGLPESAAAAVVRGPGAGRLRARRRRRGSGAF